jgi:precorrin-6A/cobalt-precorrin-6A reductase
MTILILAGTAEARALAHELDRQGVSVVSSLAGRVSKPALPQGPVRVGGFGGVDGLTRYLEEQEIEAVVDATHPFAAQISAHAAAATRAYGCPLWRLERPSWSDRPRAASWTWVADVDAVLEAAPQCRRPFLTTGRQSLHRFLGWGDRDVLARVVDPPEMEWPPRWRLIVARGPYTYESELAIMKEHRTDALITKDSGGTHTVGKLDAAAELGVPVVVVRRPAPPVDVPVLSDVPSAVRVLAQLRT